MPEEDVSLSGSEMGLLEQVAEKLRQRDAQKYNKKPHLLVPLIQDVVDEIDKEYPGAFRKYGQGDEYAETYFGGLIAGVLWERFGVSPQKANKAIGLWNCKLFKKT